MSDTIIALIASVATITISTVFAPFISNGANLLCKKIKYRKKCQEHKEKFLKGLQGYLVQGEKFGRVDTKNLSKESRTGKCFFNIEFLEKNKKEDSETSKLITDKTKLAKQNSIKEYGDLKTVKVILNKRQELKFIVTNKKAINEDTFDTQFAIQYPQDNLDIYKNKLSNYIKNKYKFELCSMDFNNFLKNHHFFYFENLSLQSETYKNIIHFDYKGDCFQTILKNADIEFNQDNISYVQCELWDDFRHEHAELEVDFNKLFKKNKFQKVRDWLWAKENKLPELIINKSNDNQSKT